MGREQLTKEKRGREFPQGRAPLESSTPRPGARKAHGTAEKYMYLYAAEPRPAGLILTAEYRYMYFSIAVLEQPSPRRALGDELGRRNVVLLQSSELNGQRGTNAKLTQQFHPRKKRHEDETGYPRPTQ